MVDTPKIIFEEAKSALKCTIYGLSARAMREIWMKKYNARWILNPIILSVFISIFCSGCFGPGIGDFEFDVAGGYKVFRTSTNNVYVVPEVRGDSKDSIPAEVVEVAWDDRFVIAKQDAHNVNYWIMDTTIQRAYGPYNLEDFEKNRQLLGVSPEITLKHVHAYPKKKSKADRDYDFLLVCMFLTPVVIALVIIGCMFMFLIRISKISKRIEHKLEQMNR